MTHTLDIFRLETCGVLWLESAATLEHAKTRVRELAARAPGEYLVLDQKQATNASSSLWGDRAPSPTGS